MDHTLPPNLSEAKKRIEEANRSASTTLDLSGLQLTSVPEEVWELTNLTILRLSHNPLKSLPKEIERLTNLTTLYLSMNQLVSLPEEIGGLTNLTFLNLSYNPELVYPPYSMIKSYNVAKEVLEFCKTQPNIFTRRGRRKNMWKTLQLMYIAQIDPHCSETFGKLPTEVLNLIEYFAISEPYVEPYVESKKRKRKE